MPTAENTSVTEPFEQFTIKLDVKEVRLDVVVVDGKGRPITDLTAADFEVFQNRLPQEVTSGVYINNQTDATAQLSVSQKDSPDFSKLPVKTLREEDIRRTILFVVDNLSMNFQHLYYAKMSIKRFMERQMQPGDMVAVMSTSYGNSALDFFSYDKRLITKRVDAIPAEMYWKDQDKDNLHRIYGNQLSTLSYSIRALKDMPGRKILFFMTSLPTVYHPPPVIFDKIPVDYYEIYRAAFERLADDALKAGVVVHSMDARGAETELDTLELYHGINPLPAKTGGIYVDNNFFTDGIGKEANNMISGYYLVSYTPPPTTFNLSRRNVYHRVEVRVKRKGAVVHTRDGFYGRTESETDAAAPPAHPLQDAIFSPFKHAGLNVNVAAGYVKDAKAGYLVRSWMHLDPKDVKLVETEDGGARIDVEAVCLTSDIIGNVHDFVHTNYTFSIKPEKKSENIAWIQKHGIRFSLLLPVKKPGSYAVRIAVQDMESGRIGSAWQTVEIPDLGKRKSPALSNIFMITSADDLNWMRSDVTEGGFSTMFQEDAVRSPALRTYSIGDRLQTLTLLYNADEKAVARSEFEMRSVLYRDGKEFLRGEPRPINPETAGNPDGITILQQLSIGSDLTPGDYVLQLVITDKRKSKKQEDVASETLSFSVVEK